VIAAPAPSTTEAVSWAEPPTLTRIELGLNETPTATCRTVTATVACKDPLVTVTFAVPFPTAVTEPVEETLATLPSDEVHERA